MKHLITILFILSTLGVSPTPDNNTYFAQLPEIIVIGDILEDYVPKRTKTEQEFIIHNRPLFQYIAKYTWLTEAQVFSFLRMEQGNGSNLFIIHNNPFNVKGKGVTYKTWEVTIDQKESASFRSYTTIKEGVQHFIDLMNTKYHSKPLSDYEHAKHLYNKGYFTDVKWQIRSILAKRYKKYNV